MLVTDAGHICLRGALQPARGLPLKSVTFALAIAAALLLVCFYSLRFKFCPVLGLRREFRGRSSCPRRLWKRPLLRKWSIVVVPRNERVALRVM